jgi:8-oxo-dGTP pyrophosphatase MutT (NUDIX family)
MHLKIYFNDKPLFLCDTIDQMIQPYVHHDDTLFIDELNSHTVKTMLHEMQQQSVHAGVFFHPDLDELKKTFFKKFTFVPAAGGLVLNEKKEVLLIYRRKKWDLPKGKLEKKERLEDCAVREVEEETGLKNTRIISPLTITWHTYHEGTRFILKESHWYRMGVSGAQTLSPQTEEDIQEIRWVNPNELVTYRKNTYPSIVDVIDSFLEVV